MNTERPRLSPSYKNVNAIFRSLTALIVSNFADSKYAAR